MASVLDEQFNVDLFLAKALIGQLIDAGDREICCRWIKKLCSMKSSEPLVKKHRNSFFKYLLKIIRNSAFDGRENNSYPAYNDERRTLTKRTEFTSHWSADGRTYVAMKALPGRGALLYIAVTKQPLLGWDFHN